MAAENIVAGACVEQAIGDGAFQVVSVIRLDAFLVARIDRVESDRLDRASLKIDGRGVVGDGRKGEIADELSAVNVKSVESA